MPLISVNNGIIQSSLPLDGRTYSATSLALDENARVAEVPVGISCAGLLGAENNNVIWTDSLRCCFMAESLEQCENWGSEDKVSAAFRSGDLSDSDVNMRYLFSVPGTVDSARTRAVDSWCSNSSVPSNNTLTRVMFLILVASSAALSPNFSQLLPDNIKVCKLDGNDCNNFSKPINKCYLSEQRLGILFLLDSHLALCIEALSSSVRTRSRGLRN